MRRSAVAALVSIAVLCGAGAAGTVPVYYPVDVSPFGSFGPPVASQNQIVAVMCRNSAELYAARR